MKRTFERIVFPVLTVAAVSAAFLSCDDMYHEARVQMDGSNTTVLVSDILIKGILPGGPPNPTGDTRVPQNIYFNDHDPKAANISGDIMLIPPLDETGIFDYTVYWGSDAVTKLGGQAAMPITIMMPVGNTIIQSLGGASITIPIGATYLLAYVETIDGENATPASVKITDISITSLDIVAGGTGSNPTGMTVYNSKLYFAANGATGRQLLEYTDTISFVPGSNPLPYIININGDSNPSNFAIYNNKLFFQATDGTSTINIGNELFSYDGVSTITAYDINNFPNTWDNNSYPSYLTVAGPNLFFVATTGIPPADMRDLYSFDGTNKQLFSLGVATNTNPAYPCLYNGTLYVSGNGFDGAGIELWQMNGVSRVSNINIAGDSNPSYMSVFNSKMYFQADDGTHGAELWVYDDKLPVSASNPVMVADINPGVAGSFPKDFIVYNSRLYFQADNGTSGAELWVYDDKLPVSGTNPAMVTDIAPGAGGSNPDEFRVFNNKLFFSAANDGIYSELWVYDDRLPVMTGFNPAMVSSGSALYPMDLAIYNNKLYYAADTFATGAELWVYEER